ncbi:hypothetical protein Tco_0412544 [Tanacetum coccineum]
MSALEAWAGQTDAQRAVLWHAITDVQRENQDLWLQLAEERRARLELSEVVDEERRARLELAKVVDGMRRGQEPRRDLPCVSALRLVSSDRADTHFLNRMWHVMWLVCSCNDVV